MKNDDFFELINNSLITSIGVDSVSETNLYKLYDIIANRNKCTVEYIHINSNNVNISKSNNYNSYCITTFDEIYEIISKLKNKMIIIDYLHNLILLVKTNLTYKFYKSCLNKLQRYCLENNCKLIINNGVYLNNVERVNVIKGGDNILYISDNVFILTDNILKTEKSRQGVIINLPIDSFIREENIKSLLD